MANINVFSDVSEKELLHIYKEILQGREDVLRPRCLDKYIQIIQQEYPLSFGEGWRYAEIFFWEEVARRYFSQIENEE